jgi:hypothetical protein
MGPRGAGEREDGSLGSAQLEVVNPRFHRIAFDIGMISAAKPPYFDSVVLES